MTRFPSRARKNVEITLSQQCEPHLASVKAYRFLRYELVTSLSQKAERLMTSCTETSLFIRFCEAGWSAVAGWLGYGQRPGSWSDNVILLLLPRFPGTAAEVYHRGSPIPLPARG